MSKRNQIFISGNGNSIGNISQTVNQRGGNSQNTEPDDLKAKVRSLVSKNKLEEAIHLIESLNSNIKELDNANLLNLGRLHALKMQNIKGTITDQEYRLELTKIAESILTLTELLP